MTDQKEENTPPKEATNALYNDLRGGRTENVWAFLKKYGNRVFREDSQGLLMLNAVSSCNAEMVQLLLDNQAVITDIALHMAFRWGCLDVAALLLPHNKDPGLALAGLRHMKTAIWAKDQGFDIKKYGGEAIASIVPIMPGPSEEILNVISFLIKEGADPGYTFKSGTKNSVPDYDCLMETADRGQPVYVELFLRHGVDPLRKNAQGNTALMLAENLSHESARHAACAGLIQKKIDENERRMMQEIENVCMNGTSKKMSTTRPIILRKNPAP